MHHFLLIIAFTLCTLTSGFAQNKSNSVSTEKPLLWRIEGEKPSYVFGTAHLTDPAIAKLSKELDAAILSADAILTEIPMDSASHAKLEKEMLGVMMLPNGTSLKSVLPPDLHRDLMAEFDRILPGLGRGMEQFKPVYVASILGMMEEIIQYPDGEPLDRIIAKRGEQLGKQVAGLETFSEQISVFESFSRGEEIQLVLESIEFLKHYRKMGLDSVKELKSAYMAGNLDELDKLINGYLAMSKDKDLSNKFLRILITDRNRRMAQRAVARLRAESDKSFVFAVGAGHLGGENGLLKLIEKEGFKIVRVQGTAR